MDVYLPLCLSLFLSVNISLVSQQVQTQMAALLRQKQKCYINV